MDHVEVHFLLTQRFLIEFPIFLVNLKCIFALHPDNEDQDNNGLLVSNGQSLRATIRHTAELRSSRVDLLLGLYIKNFFLS